MRHELSRRPSAVLADQLLSHVHQGVQAMSARSMLLCLLLMAASCGSEAAPPARGAAAGSGASTATHCQAGQSACYCPDGQMSGTQTCDARGQRSACQCNATASMSTELGAMSAPTEVCPQLPGGATCAARSFVSPQLPASVLFVVDRSGSMNCNAPPVQSVESCNL